MTGSQRDETWSGEEVQTAECTSLRVLLVGYGMVGKALAGRLNDRAAALTIVDPDKVGAPAAVPVDERLPAELSSIDLIVSAVPASASETVARALAERGAASLYVDLSTSAPRAKRRMAPIVEESGGRFIDGAIMGAVDLHGADTPVIVAGKAAPEVATALRSLGVPVTAIADSAPGDAAALKLLRSVITKGVEALAVEAYVAADRLGLSGALRESLADVSRTPFPDFLDSVVRTHPCHAGRRAHEVEAVILELSERGLPSGVTSAVLDRFRRSAQRALTERPPSHKTVRTAVDWLSQEAK